MKDFKLMEILEKRFNDNMQRHQNYTWQDIKNIIEENKKLLQIIQNMEDLDGQPDVVEIDNKLYYIDCSKESPTKRRNLCYDDLALAQRKSNKPINSAINQAKEIGSSILDEKLYRQLQEIEEYDLKSSSWILTPDYIRKLGGALFCDRRYDTVFTYHNGAQSYYSSRGYRTYLKIK